MDVLSFDRHRAEIVAQSDLLRAHLDGADLTTPVPSCPGWNVGQLARHLGGGQQWAAEVVRTRAAEPPSDAHFRDLSPYADEDPAVVGPWLVEGAAGLAEALTAAGPEVTTWTPLPVPAAGAFWARRFAHETLLHRADAALALGVDFAVDPAVAVDALDEWMELGSLPQMFDFHPHRRELLGPGRTLHLHATDLPAAAGAEWLVDLTGDTLAWRRAHEKAAVAVRGPVSELLLLVYGRRPVDTAVVEVLGDAKLLDFWLERVAFG
ncbi:maleylpyruvate isomerase family mycothiol-dependent enzyme [Micromonospora soli]|uniref:maleylpyruvate isomerase family mycothiol-dependent enzyme n=1 Tax=Micromonospora sp. NBRC 110009 TaxID=3061627 RepID=UPI002672321C|nr:maleylpyruvate isomerase family mycothiol-dependent enzyme [Micromonospora sp. NBRC 110009]WKT97807.1 maleylpyruvate isomerase family mycothiol-dependent enzyme [Micromonospora sp. NBRC 110009]